MKRTTNFFSLVLALVMLLSIAAPFAASAETTIYSIDLDYHFDSFDRAELYIPESKHLAVRTSYIECTDGYTYFDVYHPQKEYQYTIFAEIEAEQGYQIPSRLTSFVYNGVWFSPYNGGGAVPAGYYSVTSDNTVVFRAKYNYLAIQDEQGETVHCASMNRFVIEGEQVPFTDFDCCNDKRHISSFSVQGNATLRYTDYRVANNYVTMGSSASTVTATFVHNHSIYKNVLKKSGIGTEGEFVYKCKSCSFTDSETSRVLPAVDMEMEGFNDGYSNYTKLYYNGKNQYLGVTLTFEGRPLKADEYDITYPAESRKVGTYTATLRVHSDCFEDEITYNYEIFLGKPKVTAKAGVNAVGLSWKKVPGATGYRVYGYNLKTGKYTKIADTKNLTYTRKGRAAGTKYTYLVRAFYTNKEGKVVLSPYDYSDNVSVVTLCSAPKAKATVSGKTVTLRWGKVSGAKYYRVYKYNTRTKKYSTLVKSTTKLTASFKNQPKGNNYYLVRAFNSAGAGSNYTTKNLVRAVVRR